MRLWLKTTAETPPGLWCDLVVHLPSMRKALGSIPNATKYIKNTDLKVLAPSCRVSAIGPVTAPERWWVEATPQPQLLALRVGWGPLPLLGAQEGVVALGCHFGMEVGHLGIEMAPDAVPWAGSEIGSFEIPFCRGGH